VRRDAIAGIALVAVLWSAAPPPSHRVTGWAAVPREAAAADGGMVGAPATPFQLKSVDGGAVDLASFRGKPLVINFFASWCDPCRAEMPLINELAARRIEGGYGVVGIAVEDTRAAVVQYVQQAGIAFPVALDTASAVKRAYRIYGPPATFFIDAEGTIRDAVLGPLSPDRARVAMQRAGIRQ
jgi:cytochrome c biogenesis protein CcmG/thiol:disulfide interchange protein DsbE